MVSWSYNDGFLRIWTHRSLFDSLDRGGLHDPINKNSRRVDLVSVEFSRLNQLFDLGDANLSACRNHRIEVARGFAKDEISEMVALPGLHERDICANRPLENISLSVKDLVWLALGDDGAKPRAGVEGWDARASCAQSLGQCALGCELELEFAGHKLPLELGVFANVTRDHLAYLPGFQEQSKPPIVDAGVIARDSQVLRATLPQCDDEILWDSAEPKSAHRDQLIVCDDPLERLIAGRKHFGCSHERECKQLH